MEEKKTVRSPDPHRRHVLIWKLFWWPVRLIAWLKFGFVPVSERVKGPFLLVCNHNTDWDPLLVGSSFWDGQMYFVASEHIFRSPLLGRLIAWAQDPIPRQKGGSAATAVKAMLRCLKAGHNVAVFPEGNRSWDGVTGEFPTSIGKLCRSCGATLVTYRLSGGYFASPRWSGSSSRRGRMRGRVTGVYSPEELKSMTAEEINARIREGIFEDAYEEARKDPVRYRGRRLAEHLETLLYLCPGCRRYHTLESKGDTLRCRRCGLQVRYLPTGFLEGENLPFDNLRDWNRWQEQELRARCRLAAEEAVVSDTGIVAEEVFSARGQKRLGKGEMRLYWDRLELPGLTIPLREIEGMSVMGAQRLFVGAGGRSYQLRSDHPCSMIQYVAACRFLTGREDLGV
ncbi:MAG: 1-acyl-sn-glycerol-3-phosphate acyltransferase [Oscillospiraceae bacterium]|nr:1-acyl-sn-glycerol-3-phosphate acyltransferase [Oscillospiraceae bacterium]